MGTVAKKTVGQSVVWYDKDEPQRWLDAIGPSVNKVVEEFVNLPLVAAGTPAAYTTTVTGSSTTALIDGSLGGALLVTTGGTTLDGISMQALGEAFLPSVSNEVYFGVSFQVSDATQSTILAGLSITSTDPGVTGVSDGIYFRKADGSTTMNMVVETASTETEVAALTVVAATDYILEWTWNGAALAFYVNGVAGTAPAITNIPTAEYMSPVFQLLAGADAAKTATLYWMRCLSVNR